MTQDFSHIVGYAKKEAYLKADPRDLMQELTKGFLRRYRKAASKDIDKSIDKSSGSVTDYPRWHKRSQGIQKATMRSIVHLTHQTSGIEF